jgi:hypothetical protein
MHEQTLAAAIAAGWTDCFVQDGKVWGYAIACDVMPQVFEEGRRKGEGLLQFECHVCVIRILSPVDLERSNNRALFSGADFVPYITTPLPFQRSNPIFRVVNADELPALIFQTLWRSGRQTRARIQAGQVDWIDAGFIVRYCFGSEIELEIFLP